MVAGDVVNTAARLQAAAPVNGVLVGEATYRATAHVIEYRRPPPVVAKGKARAGPRVGGARAARAVRGRPRAGGRRAARRPRPTSSTCCATRSLASRREREPAARHARRRPGHRQEPARRRALQHRRRRPRPVSWRQGRCLPYGEGVSFWALGEMVKAQAGILETTTRPTSRRKLAERGRGGRARRRGGRLDRRPPAAAGRPRPRQARAASGAARPSPPGGASSRRWPSSVPRCSSSRTCTGPTTGCSTSSTGSSTAPTGVPLLVVCSARPELLTRRPGWGGGKANASRSRSRRSRDEDTARLLGGCSSRRCSRQSMQQTLLRAPEATRSSPRSTSACCATRARCAARATLAPRRAGRGAGDGAGHHRGASRRASPQRRRRSLQDAAVLGKVFWLGAVAAVGGRSRWDTEELLHSLERKELVRRERRASVAGETDTSSATCSCATSPTADPAGAPRRPAPAAAAWIESLAADRTEDRAEMLAHHYVAALELVRAAGARRAQSRRRRGSRCGRRAAGVALSALDAAAPFYRAALELWPESIGIGRGCCWSSVTRSTRQVGGRRGAAGGGLPTLESRRRRGRVGGGVAAG